MDKLPDAIQHLADAIEKKGLKIQFGLEQQGHILYIEQKIAESGWNYHTWREIGEHIGWEPLTASCYYYQYLAEKSKWIRVDDRSPEKQCHCLVIAPKSFPKNCTVVVAEFYDDNKIFYSESGDYPMEDVTHWMYVPSPPKN